MDTGDDTLTPPPPLSPPSPPFDPLSFPPTLKTNGYWYGGVPPLAENSTKPSDAVMEEGAWISGETKIATKKFKKNNFYVTDFFFFRS